MIEWHYCTQQVRVGHGFAMSTINLKYQWEDGVSYNRGIQIVYSRCHDGGNAVSGVSWSGTPVHCLANSPVHSRSTSSFYSVKHSPPTSTLSCGTSLKVCPPTDHVACEMSTKGPKKRKKKKKANACAHCGQKCCTLLHS